MKLKKCPYCGRRISYVSAYASRRKAEYVCERCGKESKVVINRSSIPMFLLFLLISVVVMVVWIIGGLSNNPLGILLVAVPLVIYAVISPRFVSYQPLKKYRKSMEARKAGIAYSDNLDVSQLSESEAPSFDNSQSFKINSDIFNTIKAERNEARARLQEDDIVSDSSKADDDVKTYERISKDTLDNFSDNENSEFVSVINDVSESHSSADAPLKKLHSDSYGNSVRMNHYIPREKNEKTEKKTDTNRYSANRRF